MSLLDSKVKLVGCDVFVHSDSLPKMPENIAAFRLALISNRGTKVWPGPTPNIHLTDIHCCRFMSESGGHVSHGDVLKLLGSVDAAGFEWVHVEKLLEIDGKPGFAKAQGE